MSSKGTDRTLTLEPFFILAESVVLTSRFLDIFMDFNISQISVTVWFPIIKSYTLAIILYTTSYYYIAIPKKNTKTLNKYNFKSVIWIASLTHHLSFQIKNQIHRIKNSMLM